jgi:broad specificity phosphatase PhoE
MPRPPIYFLRHGETDYNAAGRLQGRLDIPLNAKGRGQAARNGGVLSELIDVPASMHYVASPLLRTRQTMQIARSCLKLPETPFDMDERLVEIDFGRWEGKSWDEVKRDDAAEYQSRQVNGYGHPAPDGESYAMVMARVKAWLADVTRPTVVVAHGGIMRCLRGHVLGLAPQDMLTLTVPQDRVMLIEGGAVRLL